MSIADYYSSKKRKPSITENEFKTVGDFYIKFIQPLLPNPKTVHAFHNMLVNYCKDQDAIFLIRKYESTKKSGEWDNRRGAVTKFTDGFEYVFASNFLAHDIYLMAYNDFVPDYADFKQMIKNRLLRLAGGTKVEKAIRLYPVVSKALTKPNDFYLAHIEGVNGRYLRDNNSCRALSRKESAHIYPRGERSDWDTEDGIRVIDEYCLNDEEKAIVRAHFMRFLDPMNYFLTPLIEDFSHSVIGFTKNIGELPQLINYVKQQNRKLYGNAFPEFLTWARAEETKGQEVDADGNMEINGCYQLGINASAAVEIPRTTPAKAPRAAKPAGRTTTNGSSGIGQYIKSELTRLLEGDRLTPAMIENLKNKDYCREKFSISYPVLVEATEPLNRYYKGEPVCGKYRICSQWVEKLHHREKFNKWLSDITTPPVPLI